MCEKPSNYLVLESQFSNGLKLFIVLLSTRAQPKTKKLQWRRRWRGGILLHTAVVGLQGARGGCKQFSQYYSNTAQCFAAGRQRVTHKQVFVVAALSRILLEQTALYPPPARRANAPWSRSAAAALCSGRRPSSLQPIHSRTECLVHLFIRNNQKH